MKTVMAGATGFIGRRLVQALQERGDEVVCLSRRPEKGRAVFNDEVRCVRWDADPGGDWASELEGADAVVNLAGENLAAGRWSAERKGKILSSRIGSGKALAGAVRSARARPGIFVQASAVGYYGIRAEGPVEEHSASGEGFLASVCRQWEDSTAVLDSLGVRRVILRTGLVLGRDGGVLSKMMLPFRFFLGGRLGSGRQIVSWIHLQDLIRAVLFLMDGVGLSGAFNLTSPGAVSQKEFTRILGRVMRRPAWFPLPAVVLKAVLGEMAEETVLSGLKVIPRKLLDEGFDFRFPELEEALKNLLE